MTGWWTRTAMAWGLALACASGVAAEEPPGVSDVATPQAPPLEAPPATGVALDQLLTLPQARTYSVERKAGLTRGEWRARYDEVRSDLQKERAAYEETQAKLEDAAGGAWSVSPIPGVEQDTSRNPVDFQLRTQLRRHREEMDRLERKLRQLDIEANLAGVPEEWRR
jgi:hypothetical protein